MIGGKTLKLIVKNNSSEIAETVSAAIAAQIRKKPDSVLGFATGSSPIETYEKLIKKHEAGELSFKNVRSFNLDEYCGLSHEDPHSYFFFMQEKLFSRIDIDPENIHFMNGLAENDELECRRYSETLRQEGIDIQLLGVGRNGHIGFNEPSDKFSDGAFCVTLEDSTIEANKRFFEKKDDVPTKALTMGIGDIMSARKIILIATGSAKAEAIRSLILGEVTPLCPVSILQRHPNATVYCDPEAARLIR